MKTILYIRNIQDGQNPSIEEQRAVCHKFAAEHGFEVVDEYISEDALISSNVSDELIKKCKEKKIGTVLTYSDKLISYPAPILTQERVMLMQKHISLICIQRTDDLATLLLENTILNFLEFQRAEHSARVKRGMQLAKERKAAQAAAEGNPVA